MKFMLKIYIEWKFHLYYDLFDRKFMRVRVSCLPMHPIFLKKQLEHLHKIKNIIENLNFLSFFRLQSLATPRSAWCCDSHSVYQLLYRETPQDGRIPYISENNEQNWIFIFSMYILYTMYCVIIFLMQCFWNSDNLQL